MIDKLSMAVLDLATEDGYTIAEILGGILLHVSFDTRDDAIVEARRVLDKMCRDGLISAYTETGQSETTLSCSEFMERLKENSEWDPQRPWERRVWVVATSAGLEVYRQNYELLQS